MTFRFASTNGSYKRPDNLFRKFERYGIII
jgi:hypothetical protein